MNNILDDINTPEDIKKLPLDKLPVLSQEIRSFLIDSASKNPCHLGANLGVVELTIAIHRVFNVPNDQLIWDVGHQAYVHKILTGRKDVFDTNRKYKGLSGFPSRAESKYDAFGTGHSSTSISAALGIAIAQNLQNNKQHVIAVIGDGSLTGGEAFEALNNAGASKADILVILNDNNMAIDPSVGAIKENLLRITTSGIYNNLKKRVWNRTERFSKLRSLLGKTKRSLKSFLFKQSNLFEEMNFRYFGPVNGHDVITLTKILTDLSKIPGPKLLHVLTIKGKGYKYAEIDQTRYHSPGLFDIETGESYKSKEEVLYQDVFGKTLIELASQNEKIVAITPAMCSGSGLREFREKYSERFFDVGIAEPHAVTFSAGMATQGLIPFCVIYSSFMQRAFDQLIHDVAIQKLPVIICLDRAGLVGADGATHHGAFDLAYTRFIPNITIAAPMDSTELRNVMFTAQTGKYGAFVIRYPKGSVKTANWETPMIELAPGHGRTLQEGENIAIVTIGSAGLIAKEVVSSLLGENIQVGHFDMRYLKPIDKDLLKHIATNYATIITIEDGVITGGLGSAVDEYIQDNQYHNRVIRLGIPDDRFILHGSNKELYKECGYDQESIYNTIKSMLK